MSRKIVLAMTLTIVLIGMLGIAVKVQKVKASGTIYIGADGSVKSTTHISSVDNVTYTFTDNINDSIVVLRDNLVIDGAGYTLQMSGMMVILLAETIGATTTVLTCLVALTKMRWAVME